jgi:hypothetical protein
VLPASALAVGMMLRLLTAANKVAATAAMRDGRAEDVMLTILVGIGGIFPPLMLTR